MSANFVTLAAAPARFTPGGAHDDGDAWSDLSVSADALNNAGLTAPIRIATQASRCPPNAQMLRQFVAPTNLWTVQATPCNPESLTQVQGSLQAVAMQTPVPTLLGLGNGGMEGPAALFGQNPGFVRNFYAAQLAQVAQLPNQTVQFSNLATCQPNTFGAWYGASVQAGDDACNAVLISQQARTTYDEGEVDPAII